MTLKKNKNNNDINIWLDMFCIINDYIIIINCKRSKFHCFIFCYFVVPCGSNPCLFGGQCFDDPSQFSGYRCVCVSGYTGLTCNIIGEYREKIHHLLKF